MVRSQFGINLCKSLCVISVAFSTSVSNSTELKQTHIQLPLNHSLSIPCLGWRLSHLPTAWVIPSHSTIPPATTSLFLGSPFPSFCRHCFTLRWLLSFLIYCRCPAFLNPFSLRHNPACRPGSFSRLKAGWSTCPIVPSDRKCLPTHSWLLVPHRCSINELMYSLCQSLLPQWNKGLLRVPVGS